MRKLYIVTVVEQENYKNTFAVYTHLVGAHSKYEAQGFVTDKYTNKSKIYTFGTQEISKDFCKEIYELEDLRTAEEIG